MTECVKTLVTELSMENICLSSFCEKWRHFQDFDIPYLVAFLRSNQNVTSLDLAYNNICCAGFMNLIDYITTFGHILELNAQHNSIAEPGIRHLCQVGENMLLKMLRMNGNKFGVEAAKKLALFLLQISHLTHLDVAEVN